MNELKENLLQVHADGSVRSITQLLHLYDGAIDELRFCANIDPALELDNAAADLQESDLLNVESNLLDQAAQISLNSKDDILKLMDLWAKVSGVGEGDQPSPADRIAMNIFRHISQLMVSKD